MMLLKLFNQLSLHPKNAAELKGLILQLAVQGKLTARWREENPNVEPASKYFDDNRIRISGSEGKRMDVPFNLPSTWLWLMFIDVAELRHGHQFRQHDFVESGIPVIKIGQCKPDGTLDLSSCNYIDKARMEEFKDVRIYKGHLLMALTGGTLGKVTRVKYDYGEIVQNYRVGNFFTDEKVLSLDFLNVVLESDLFQRLVSERVNQNAQPNIGKDNIEKILLPIPPISEQHAIVTTVNQLFAEVEQLEQLTKDCIQLKHDFATSALQRLVQAGNINGEWAAVQQHFHTFFNEKPNVKKLRETILQLAVQGKLTTHWRKENPGVEPATELLKRITAEKQELLQAGKIKKEKPLPPIKEDEISFELPKGWVWCRLRDIISILGDGIHGTPKYSIDGSVYFVNGNNLNDGVIEIKSNTKTVSVEEAKKHARHLTERTVLVSINGTIGNTAFYNEEMIILGKSACYFNLLQDINKEFIRQIIKSNYFLNYAFNSATGTTIKNVSLRTMREFLVPLPSIEEQHAIVTTVNTLMSLCDALEQELGLQESRVEELMRSCVREVVDG